MSAYISGFTFPSLFNSSASLDDGFWQEPSTVKIRLTAAESLIAEAGTCNATTTSGLIAKHSIVHRRNKSLQLHFAAPCA